MPSIHYQNFKVAVYARVYEVNQMSDLSYLTTNFEVMSRHLKIGKVYLETHRDMVVAEEATLLQAKQYLESRGVKVSGGITITVNERNRFETYCYTNPDHRQKLKEVAAFTARLFDEVILDDFFFTNCKCASCIQAKGDKSWTQFRLDLLTEAAQELVIGPARARQPERQADHQVSELVRALPGAGLQPGDRAGAVRQALHRHRNPRSPAATSTSSPTTATRSSATSKRSNRAATPAAGWTPLAAWCSTGTPNSYG